MVKMILDRPDLSDIYLGIAAEYVGVVKGSAGVK